MAQDDSRLQELLNMQNTANMPTSPTPDQPSGQFSGDDIEFEAFMFDPGTGPLAPSAAMNATMEAGTSTQVATVVPAASAPHTPNMPHLLPVTPAPTPGFEITGQQVPVPPHLRTSEPQPGPQEQAQMQPSQHQAPPVPRGTGPLGGLHSSTNLSARLAQSQSHDTPTGTDTPSIQGTGPLSRRGTGPLGGAASGSSGSSGLTDASSHSTSQQTTPASPGPINPAYFRTPTGPLSGAAAEGSVSGGTPSIASTGPLNAALLRRAAERNPEHKHSPNTQPWQASPTTWSDSALAAVEDFSAVLLSMHDTRPSSVSLIPKVNVGTSAATYGAAIAPELEEPPASEGLYTEMSQPGWGEMTGAPPASDYSHSYEEQVAAPDYDGPEMDYVVPADGSADAQKQAAHGSVEMQVQQPEQTAHTEQAEQAEAPAYNSINPNDLQFEGFMFNQGESAVSPVGPPLPGMEEFMPSVVSMEAAFEQPKPAMPPYAAIAPDRDTEPKLQAPSYFMEEEPAPFDPAMQLAVASEQYTAQPESPHTQEAQSALVAQDTPDAQTQTSDQGPLPFWLQDTSDLQAIARQGYVNIDAEPGFGQPDTGLPLAMQSAAPLEAPAYEVPAYESLAAPPTMFAHTLPPVEEETPQAAPSADMAPFDTPALEPVTSQYSPPDAEVAEPQDQSFYEDLPPIEPFDFTSLGLAPEEEKLGFNTEELTGMMPSRHDPMRATADLDVLADIFDGMPVGSPMDTKPAFLRTSPLGGLLSVEPEVGADVEESEPPDTTQATESPYASPSKPVAPSPAPSPSNVTSPIASFLTPSAEEDLNSQIVPVQTTDSGKNQTSGGWTSMVTTALSMDTPDEYESMETGMLMAAPASSTESLPALELDIEPFDYNRLNLEQEQEIPTGMLDPMRGIRPGSVVETGNLVTPGAQPTQAASPMSEFAPDAEEHDGDDEEAWEGTERDTSLFMSTSPRLNERARSSLSPRSTGWLTDDGAPDVQELGETEDTPAPQQPSVDQASKNAGRSATTRKGVKARVARGEAVQAEPPTPPAAPQEGKQARAKKAPPAVSRALFATQEDGETAEEPQQAAAKQDAPAPAPVPAPVPTAPAPAEPVYSYQPMQGYAADAEPRVEMPKVGAVRDIYTSGPLPELEGFDALRTIVDNNPDDLGAHIALAAAYTQLGDPDTALRVYHRILKKRAVSDSILRLITEELNDFETGLQGNAKYHQVRGDLYTRQGRHQEAIREYNKIV